MANYYVNNSTGSDANAGTSSGSPKATYSAGVALLSAGDNLYIEATATPYAMANIANIPSGVNFIGSAKPDPVTGVAVKIDGSGGDYYHYFLGSFTMTNIWYHDIIDSSFGGLFYTNRSATGHLTQNYTDCIFSEMKGVSSTAGRGGILAGGAGVGAYTADSITYNLTGCLFKNIESYGNTSAGALFIHSSGTFIVNITQCTWYQGTPTNYALDAIAADYSGIYTTITLTNCAVVNDSGQTLVIHGNYSGASIGADTSFTLTGSTYTNISTTNGTITNSTNADADFLDPSGLDFRLPKDSPAVDRGVVI